MDIQELDSLFSGMDELHVLVIGDVMLDSYWWGDVERVSPEAPVPVVTLRRQEARLGGAANVALNCRALGARVTLASVIGNDEAGHMLTGLVREAGIGTELLQVSATRKTTRKTRVISRSQQMLRLDEEEQSELSVQDEHPFIDAVLKYLQLEKPAVVIFEDYDKGVLKENVIRHVIRHSREIGALTAVDPKKNNFLTYQGVTIFKPNLKEVREGLGVTLGEAELTSDRLEEIDRILRGRLEHEITFITLSEKGVYYNDGSNARIIDSHLRNIADVSGAGDTVIATAAMVHSLTRNCELMAGISNIAGGLVCETVGVVPVRKEMLHKEAVRLLQ